MKASNSPEDPPSGNDPPAAGVRMMPRVSFHLARIEEVERAEGYREVRCLPAHWRYLDPEPFEALVAEHDSGSVNMDEEPDFWSASDAVLRTRSLPRERLDVREAMLMATRRAIDYNAPKPWVSRARVSAIAERWEAHATDVHPFARLTSEIPHDLWNRAGMGTLDGGGQQVMTGYNIRAGERDTPPLEPWHGGPGTFYSWKTLAGWSRWPRRQAVDTYSTPAVEGSLLLFVSHRWEDLAHPDPSGRQLLALKAGMTLALAAAVLGDTRTTASGLPELLAQFLHARLDASVFDTLRPWAELVRGAARKATAEAPLWRALERLRRREPDVERLLGAISERVLVWYDYASMFQSPRTPDEQRLFRADLERLNHVQACAATLVIAGDDQYESRAWCFLEICGGIRHRIVELTPSWGTPLNVWKQVTRWAQRSDQLVGALVVHGPAAIRGSGLSATDEDDLPVIARLLTQLPLVGLIESDGSDLIGGSIPWPLRERRWFFGDRTERSPDATYRTSPLVDHGRVPSHERVAELREIAHGDTLNGPCGVWVYTTQRVLSLAWADRAAELHGVVGRITDLGRLGEIACTWADARALGDDGEGWTRAVPSTVETLLIVTQADLPGICLLLQRVANAHLDAGTRVVTFAPETGRVDVFEPKPRETVFPAQEGREADVLVVPRIRRSTAYPRYMFLSKGARRRDIEVLAGFRLDPSDGVWLRFPEIPEAERQRLSKRRVLAECAARTLGIDWSRLADQRATDIALSNPEIAHGQLDVIERLLEEAALCSPNPFHGRRLIYVLIDDEKGYLLPESLVETARVLRQRLQADGAFE